MAAPRKAFQTSRPHLRTASFPSLRSSLSPLHRPGTARLFVISASCSRSTCIAPQRRVCTRQPDPAGHPPTMPRAGDGHIHRPCNLRQRYPVWQSRLDKDWIYSIKHRNFTEPAPRYPDEIPRMLNPRQPPIRREQTIPNSPLRCRPRSTSAAARLRPHRRSQAPHRHAMPPRQPFFAAISATARLSPTLSTSSSSGSAT